MGLPETGCAATCDAVERALQERPLSESELRLGEALRLLGCVRRRNGPGGEREPCIVDVVVLSRRSLRRARCPRLSFSQTGEPAPYALAALDSWTQDLAGSTWRVDECEVLVPVGGPSLTIAMGSSCEVIDEVRLKKMIDDYLARIMNATWDGAYRDYLMRQREVLMRRPVPTIGPLMSLVMPVYHTPPDYLREAVGSVLCQTYGGWELVLVNASPDDVGVIGVLDELSVLEDDRVHVVSINVNLGISGNTNVGIEHAHGDYLCFFDHDDVLEPYALAELVRAIQAGDEHPDLLYCDEDSLNEEGVFCHPLFKPDLNLDLLLSVNYVVHMLTVSRRIIARTVRSGDDVNGAQDYDLTLKALLAGARVAHVPHVLYHWRIHAASIASGSSSKPYAMEAGRRSIAAYLDARELDASVVIAETDFSYEVTLALPRPVPSLFCLVRGALCGKTSRAFERYGLVHGAHIEVRELPADVSAAVWADALCAMRDDAVSSVAGSVLIAMDGCVALGSADLDMLVGHFSREEVFAVTPRIVRSDDLLEHAGLLVRPDGALLRLSHVLPQSDGGHIARAVHAYDSAVLGLECVAMRSDIHLDFAGLPQGYAIPDYVLADLCLTMRKAGMLSVMCPFATGRLMEPRTLCGGAIVSEPNDQRLLLQRHASMLGHGDPSHNPNFDPWSAYYALGDPQLRFVP